MQGREGTASENRELPGRGLAPLTGAVPRKTPRTLHGRERARAGRARVSQLVTVGQIRLPASFYK